MGKVLETIILTKCKLREAISNNLYWNETCYIPLPKSKAKWLLENERIDEEDYCSLFVLENKTPIALVNLIPDLIQLNNMSNEKFYWMTLWWVKDSHKTSIIGPYLFNEALRLTNNKILGKAYAESANGFYDKQPFTVIVLRKRYTIFFCTDKGTITNKLPYLKYIKPIVAISEFISFKIISNINKNRIKSNVKKLEYEYINELNSETWDFVRPLCEKDLVLKTLEYINWQLSPKQYNQEHVDSDSNTKLVTFIVKKSNQIIGFVSFLVINKEVNLKYFLCDVNNQDFVIDAFIDNLIKLRIKYMFTDDPLVAKNISRRMAKFYVFSLIKKGIAHNDIAPRITNLELKERDGHFM